MYTTQHHTGTHHGVSIAHEGAVVASEHRQGGHLAPVVPRPVELGRHKPQHFLPRPRRHGLAEARRQARTGGRGGSGGSCRFSLNINRGLPFAAWLLLGGARKQGKKNSKEHYTLHNSRVQRLKYSIGCQRAPRYNE